MDETRDDWEQAGGEAAATGVQGGGDSEPPAGERGVSLDDNTARRRERRGEPAPPSDRVISGPDESPTAGGMAGTSSGAGDVEVAPDPYTDDPGEAGRAG